MARLLLAYSAGSSEVLRALRSSDSLTSFASEGLVPIRIPTRAKKDTLLFSPIASASARSPVSSPASPARSTHKDVPLLQYENALLFRRRVSASNFRSLTPWRCPSLSRAHPLFAFQRLILDGFETYRSDVPRTPVVSTLQDALREFEKYTESAQTSRQEEKHIRKRAQSVSSARKALQGGAETT